jgi:hypothetical protein
VLVTALAGGDRARAETARIRPDAQAHLDRGLALYQAKDYTGAARAIEAAYALDPHRDLLYVWAQAKRLGGDCAGAVALYRQFLSEEPPPKEAEMARKNVTRCEREMASGAAEGRAVDEPPALTPAPPPAPSPPPTLHTSPAKEPSAKEPSAKPWFRDLTGGLLVGAGAIGLATGGLFLWWAHDQQESARRARVYEEVVDHTQKAETRQWIAVGALAAGTGLMAAGILRYVLRAEPQPGTDVALWPVAGGGAAAGLGGQF